MGIVLIDITTFSLAAGVEDDAFLVADAQLQAALSSRDGFVRRTTARASVRAGVEGGGGGGGGGGAQGEAWLVLTLWTTVEAADRGTADVGRPAREAFDALVDQATVRVERFESLD